MLIEHFVIIIPYCSVSSFVEICISFYNDAEKIWYFLFAQLETVYSILTLVGPNKDKDLKETNYLGNIWQICGIGFLAIK